MKQENIEMVILFNRAELDIRSMVTYFSSVFEDFFDETFQEISYAIKTQNGVKGKSLRYSSKNLEKLILENPNNGFGMFRLLPNWEYKSQDIKFSFRYASEFKNKSAMIAVAVNRNSMGKAFDSKKMTETYLAIINYLKTNKITMIYGFIFSMDTRKFPGLFISGISNYNLSKSEEIELQIWADNNSEANYKIWRVFWGNLVTKKHLKAGFSLERIKTIVGANNFFLVDNDTCFFNLPNDDLLYGNEHKSSEKELLKLLNSLT
jgi:hypothetical protein